MPIGHDSDALFVGMQRHASGDVIEVYISLKDVRAAMNTKRSLLPLIGMAGAGIGGARLARSGLARLVDVYGRALDNNTPISRLKFVKAATAGGLAGLAACGGDGPGVTGPPDDGTKPRTDPVAPIPVISGPSEVQIPGFAGEVVISLDGSGTQGPVTAYEWKGTIPNTNIEGEFSLGTEATASHKTSRPGTVIFELTAYNSWAKNTATHEVAVLPAVLPSQAYDLPVVFMVTEEVSGQNIPAIYTANPQSSSTTTRLIGSDLISTTRVNWEPSGERIVLTLGRGGRGKRSLHTYSLLTGEFREITDNTSGLAWQASVSPKGEWVAYIDDSRAPNRSYDEGAIVRIDGTGQFYLCGDETNYWYGGKSPSWDNNGERIALGNVRYDITGSHDQGGGWDRRIGIIGDLWSGNPSRDYYIPSEEQLENLLATGGFNIDRDDFFATLSIGINGLAWSPDGLKVVYDLQFGFIPNNYHVLALSNVDGTENIENLAMSTDVDLNVDFFLPNSHTWSPDGQEIFFMAFSYFEKKIFRIDPTTRSMRIFSSTDSPESPSLYD